MKILYLTKNLMGTGSGTYSNLLIDGMKKWHDVTVTDYKNIPSQKWDIIHALDLKHFFLQPLLQSATPLIIDIHDYYWTKFYPFFCIDFPIRFLFQKVRRPKYLKILQKADAVIVHSQFMQRQIPHNHTFFARLGIVFDGLNQVNQKLRTNDEFNILFVGKDYFRKGIFPLLKAFKIVQQNFPEAQLLIIGEEYKHSLAFSKLLSLGLNVKFLGNVNSDKLAELYKIGHVLVLPSHIEAFGIVFLEAMSAKIPVIGTNVGGIPEIVMDGITGQLIAPNNPNQIAEAIIKSIKGDNEIENMIKTAYNHIRKNYTVECMLNDVNQIYGKVVSRR